MNLPPLNDKADRDIPNLKTTKKKTNITKLIFSGALLFGVIAVGAGGVMFMHQLEENAVKRKMVKENTKPVEVIPVEQNFEATKLRIKAENPDPLPEIAPYLPPPSATIKVAASPQNFVPIATAIQDGDESNMAPSAPIMTAQQRRMLGDVLVNTAADKSASGQKSRQDMVNAALGNISMNPPENGFDEKLKPSNLLAGHAAQRGDLRFLMRRGTSIQCGQKTKIITTQRGLVSCQISKDVYSANGDVLLVERGSEVFGEQRSTIMQGQASIEVLWTRIDTPTGVAIDVNSLATDSLGASGIPAEVDDHIMKRFGGAVMLSLIGDFGQVLVNKSMNTNGPVQLTNTASAGQDLASRTLASTINIPPTAYSSQGAAINIFVARDMDFSTVYELAHY